MPFHRARGDHNVTSIRLAIVGLGKIARDQHIPAIAATDGIELAAIASPNASIAGLAHFATLEELLSARPDVDAVALCTPPQGRHLLAAAALRAGKHVLLEKPPGATVAELNLLVETASRLSAAAENADLVSRVGGDEFAVIYNGASVHQIEAAAARIVAALQWDAGDGIMLGASVGIAWASPGSTSASLYEEADKAMYRAKTSGRNRFVAHRPAGDLDAA